MTTKLFFLPFSLAALLGCGDDQTVEMPGADATLCGGHGQPECMGVDSEYLNHNGGEIRMMVVQNPAGKLSISLYAFFISAQTPEKIPYMMYGKEENGVFGPCSATSTYANTVNATTEVNDTRVFVDMGATITLSFQGQDIVLNRYNDIADMRGLVMDIGYVFGGAATNTAPPELVVPGAEYTIKFADGTEYPYKLKMPSTWQTSGGNLLMYPNTVNSFNGPLSWQYLYPVEPLVDSAFLQFGGNNAQGVKETWFCAGEMAGRIDLPVDQMAMFPKSGTIQAGTVSHQKTNWNGRVVDVIGIYCRQTAYTIQ